MINSEKDVEFIERYLDQKLTLEERKDFEERLIADEKFASAFNVYKNLIGGIQYSGKQQLLQKLKKVEASLSAQERVEKKILGISSKNFYSYSMAASVVLLISFTVVFIVNQRSTSASLYDEYFNPYQNIVSVTTRGDNSMKTLKEKAFIQYDLEEYQSANNQFEKILKDTNDAEVLLYSGNTYMVLNNYDSAISKLSLLTKLDSPFTLQAEWYLALSYLAKGEKETAVALFEKIRDGKVSYSKKAQNILNSLN